MNLMIQITLLTIDDALIQMLGLTGTNTDNFASYLHKLHRENTTTEYLLSSHKDIFNGGIEICYLVIYLET